MRFIIAALLFVTAGASAHADTTFEAQSQGAQPVARVDDLVWALSAPCDVTAERTEVQARQCRLIRDARANALRGQPLLVEGEDGAFVVGDFDAAKKSAPTSLVGCIRCKPVTVDGTPWTVYAGAPKVEAGRSIPPMPYERAQQFPDAAALAAWKKATGAPRVHFVVTAKEKAVTRGTKTIVLDVVGYRVVSPCTGEVLASSAPAQPVAADKSGCTK